MVFLFFFLLLLIPYRIISWFKTLNCKRQNRTMYIKEYLNTNKPVRVFSKITKILSVLYKITIYTKQNKR